MQIFKVDHDIITTAGLDHQRVGLSRRSESLIAADDPEVQGSTCAGIVGIRYTGVNGHELDHQKPRVGSVQQVHPVVAWLHVSFGPDLAVDDHVVAEELGQRRRATAGKDVGWQNHAFVGDEVVVERIAGEGWIEQRALIGEHAVLDGIGQLVRKGRQAKGIVRQACIKLVTDEVETREPRVDVEPRDAEGVVVVPEVSGWHGIVVTKRVGKAAGHEIPLGALDFAIRAIEELRVTVELKVAVPAVQVGDGRHPVPIDAELPVIDTVGRACSVQRVGPVQARIDRQQVLLALQLVYPTNHSLVRTVG